MSIISLRNVWFAISGTLVVVSLFLLLQFGLKLGIDFTGGSLLEITFSQTRPDKKILEGYILASGVKTDAVIQEINDNGFILRMRTLNEAEHQSILNTIKTAGYAIDEKRFDSIGPVIGSELKRKAVLASILVLVGIMVYVAWAFRGVSRIVPSWLYGLIALIALFHDVIITLGAFALLGYYYNVEVGQAFVVAILTILGYSVNDTIVVFDRIRENLLKRGSTNNLNDTVDLSINQSFTRSLNTSLTTLFVLVTIYFFGGATLKYFALALIIGISFGTYSSIFIASPLLVVIYNQLKKR